MSDVVTNTDDLHKVSQSVTPGQFERVKTDLFGFLKSIPGKQAVGIAAIQLGKPEASFAYWHTPDNDNPRLELVINPKILEYTGEQYNSIEGCLSIPGTKCIVKRYPQLTVQYEGGLDSGEDGIYVVTGEDARRFQHEFDHTQGVLITDNGIIVPSNIGRNSQCPCKSGRKWKKCCGKDEV